jgi:hypothetical protein
VKERKAFRTQIAAPPVRAGAASRGRRRDVVGLTRPPDTPGGIARDSKPPGNPRRQASSTGCRRACSGDEQPAGVWHRTAPWRVPGVSQRVCLDRAIHSRIWARSLAERRSSSACYILNGPFQNHSTGWAPFDGDEEPEPVEERKKARGPAEPGADFSGRRCGPRRASCRNFALLFVARACLGGVPPQNRRSCPSPAAAGAGNKYSDCTSRSNIQNGIWGISLLHGWQV